jgi:hypothetical protein
MSVELITTGGNQNSYITLSEANAILATTYASFYEVGETLEAGGEVYLFEAFKDLERLWSWKGQPASADQVAQWPRKYVPDPNWRVPGEPGWSAPWTGDLGWLAYKARYLDGSVSSSDIPDDVVPLDIKEAQALIAMLYKSGGNLVGDNQGDLQGTQVGKLKLSYVNPIRESAAIHKRTGQYGRFKAGLLTGV